MRRDALTSIPQTSRGERDDEVHFGAAARPVVVKRHLGPQGSHPGAKLASDEVLEKQSALVVEAAIERPAQQSVSDPDVEQVHFGVSDAGSTEASRLQAGTRKTSERVLEDLEVAPCSLEAQPRVAAQRAQVQDAAGRGRDEVEQARIATEVADQGLCLHFLAQVRIGVAAEGSAALTCIAFGPDARERAVSERSVEVELARRAPPRPAECMWWTVTRPGSRFA